MTQSVYGLLADVFLFVETASHHTDLRSALESAGYSANHHERGHDLVEEALEMVEEVAAEVLHDKTRVHLIHTAATEVEMWIQASRRRLRKAVGEGDHLELITGAGVHGDDHTLAVLAQSRRLQAMLRADEELHVAVGRKRTIEDMYQRGYSLTNKLIKLADSQCAEEIGTRIADVCDQLDDWLTTSRDAAGSAFGDDTTKMAALGWVPPGSGVALGGTAWSATRHERAQHEGDITGPAQPAPGWSIGRQGRNSLNHGKGY